MNEVWTMTDLTPLRPYLRPAPRPIPNRIALLVVDVQEHFAGICAPILDTIRKAVDACRKLGVPVFFTQHGHADPERDGGMLGEWWGDLLVEETLSHRLIPSLGVTEEDVVIAKRRYNAFFGTDLEAQLRNRGIDDLAIAGVMTNLCVETTARDAFVRDFRVRVLADATATADAAMHLASLTNLAFGFAHIQTVEQWVASLG